MIEKQIFKALRSLSLKPFEISVRKESFPVNGMYADGVVALSWNGEEEEFVVEIKGARVLRNLQTAVQQARSFADRIGKSPMVVVPYLKDTWLDYLEKEGVSGIDLCGNGYVRVPGKWWFRQGGYPNIYRRGERLPRSYRGASSLVGRVFLLRPEYGALNDIREEILRRGGTISISQVSKVVTRMEDDLIIAREKNRFRLLQPEKLLDTLTNDYILPEVIETVGIRGSVDASLLVSLRDWGDKSDIRLAGDDPARYTLLSDTRQQLRCYVDTSVRDDLPATIDPVQDIRFADVLLCVTPDRTLFFDLEESDNFRWCSMLQTYLFLMHGGKREKELALSLRDDILRTASG